MFSIRARERALEDRQDRARKAAIARGDPWPPIKYPRGRPNVRIPRAIGYCLHRIRAYGDSQVWPESGLRKDMQQWSRQHAAKACAYGFDNVEYGLYREWFQLALRAHQSGTADLL